MTDNHCWMAAGGDNGKLYLCVLPRGHSGIHNLRKFQEATEKPNPPDYCGHERPRDECRLCLKADLESAQRVVQSLADRVAGQSELLSKKAEKVTTEEKKDPVPPTPGVYRSPMGNLYYVSEIACCIDARGDFVVCRGFREGKMFCQPVSEWRLFGPTRDKRPLLEKILSVVKWEPCLTSEIDFRLRSIGTKIHSHEVLRDAILRLVNQGNLKLCYENDYRTIAWVRDLDATAKG